MFISLNETNTRIVKYSTQEKVSIFELNKTLERLLNVSLTKILKVTKDCRNYLALQIIIYN